MMAAVRVRVRSLARRLKRWVGPVVLVLLAIWAIGGGPLAEMRGRMDAGRDIRSGVLQVKVFGSRNERSKAYDALLQQRYGIRREYLGDLSHQIEHVYVRAYNDRMMVEIRNQFGTIDILETGAAAEAEFEGKRMKTE